MGRLAGPVSKKAQLRLDAVKREIELHQQYVASITPVAHPTSRWRQTALLWLVSSERGLVIGLRNRPPLTSDIRALLAKGHLQLRRRPPVHVSRSDRPPGIARFSILSLTPSGEVLLTKTRVPDIDKVYILRALHTGVLR